VTVKRILASHGIWDFLPKQLEHHIPFWNCSLKIKLFCLQGRFAQTCLRLYLRVATLCVLSVDLPSNTGFNVETVEYKNISFTVWDVGGQDKVRSTIELCLNILIIWHWFYILLLTSPIDDFIFLSASLVHFEKYYSTSRCSISEFTCL